MQTDASLVANPRLNSSSGNTGSSSSKSSSAASFLGNLNAASSSAGSSNIDAVSDNIDTTFKENQRKEQALIGRTIVSGARYKDEQNVDRVFFLFTDLSVRVQGRFCLRLQLLALQEDQHSPSLSAIDVQFSPTLTVFPPKTFPGMDSS